MQPTSGNARTDSASRIIDASPRDIYQAFLTPEAVAKWRPPKGMRCTIIDFDPREGGAYKMSFEYINIVHGTQGKTSEHADVFAGRFVELSPDNRIVELVKFESDDPAFAGEMTITTILTPVADGTEVRFECTNVPPGIDPDDHRKGMMSSLDNLADFTE